MAARAWLRVTVTVRVTVTMTDTAPESLICSRNELSGTAGNCPLVVVLTVAGDVAVVAETIVDVAPLQAFVLSFQVPLQALSAMVPVVTPATTMEYVDPTSDNVPVLVTVRYCGAAAVTEMGKATTVVDGDTFHVPDPIVCAADVRANGPA